MLKLTDKFKIAALTGVFLLSVVCGAQSQEQSDVTGNWDLAVQMWTFNRFTLFEGIDKASEAGAEWIEMYPDQAIGGDYAQATTNFNMPAEIRQVIKDKLDKAGLRIRSYGVVQPGESEQWRNLFEFCKAMGIQTITSEPSPDQLDLVEELCIEYDIKVAIHNHPRPSRYWNPETVLELIEDRDERIGVCADIGHWMRSGVDPQEALQMLSGRVIALHMKDLNAFDQGDAHDVVWSTGQADLETLFGQLYQQDFAGVITIEYEHNWDDNLDEVKGCVQYYNDIVSELDGK